MSAQLVAVVWPAVSKGDAPFVYADDLGLTRGDGCFDAVGVLAGPGGPVINDWQAHLNRLRGSAAVLGIECPSDELWNMARDRVLEQWRGSEAIIKLVLTRGRENAPVGPTAYLMLTELPAATIAQRAGIRVLTLDRGYPSDAFAAKPWLLGGVKSLSYVINQAARRYAAVHDADDVLFTSYDGYALEGPTAALVWLLDGQLGSTPTGATGILASTTLAAIERGAAADGVQVTRELLPVSKFHACQGLWLVSTGRGIAPIRTLDANPVAQHEATTYQLREWANQPS